MGQDTRGRILDEAEKLFAESGFAATSLRSVTGRAGVNLAAVHYHFGSKEALIRAVFARRVGPLNEARLRALDACEREAGKKRPPLEKILEALVGPALRLGLDPEGPAAVFMRLYGRVYTEPNDELRAFFFEQFAEIRRRFGEAFRRALPDLPTEDLFWRMHFVIGTMAQTLSDPERLTFLSGGRCDASDSEETIRQLVPFLAAAMRAPVRSRSASGSQQG